MHTLSFCTLLVMVPGNQEAAPTPAAKIPTAKPGSVKALPPATPTAQAKAAEPPLKAKLSAGPAKPATRATKPRRAGVDAMVRKLQSFYDDLEDYQARFVQKYTRIATSRTTESSGTVVVQKGGRLRFSYTDPVEKLFVSNGKTLWVYEPEEEQVVVNRNFSTRKLNGTFAFLWGEGQLTESFRVERAKAQPLGFPPKSFVLALTPKSDQTYRKLYIRVDTKTGRVEESLVLETAGNQNRFTFFEPKVNQGVEAPVFDFVPPDGVDVTSVGSY